MKKTIAIVTASVLSTIALLWVINILLIARLGDLPWFLTWPFNGLVLAIAFLATWSKLDPRHPFRFGRAADKVTEKVIWVILILMVLGLVVLVALDYLARILLGIAIAIILVLWVLWSFQIIWSTLAGLAVFGTLFLALWLVRDLAFMNPKFHLGFIVLAAFVGIQFGIMAKLFAMLREERQRRGR